MDKIYNVLVYYFNESEPKEIYDVIDYKKGIDTITFNTTTGFVLLNIMNVRQVNFTEVK